MNFITTKDATKIAYKDWGKGQPILFSHGWPLAGDAWEASRTSLGTATTWISTRTISPS